MATDRRKQLERLTEMIREEEEPSVIESMKARILDGEKCWNPSDARLMAECEKYTKLLLRSMRIHLCLDMLGKGQGFCLETLQEDWAEVICSLQVLEYQPEVTGRILADAADIVLLLEPRRRNELLQRLSFGERMKIAAQKKRPMSDTVLKCALHMAEYCLETERKEELYRIVRNLICLSEEHCSGNRAAHRSAVVSALANIVDIDRELTAQICADQERYFEDTVDSDACTFYWFYGLSLFQQERIEEMSRVLMKCHRLYMAVEGDRSWVGLRAKVICSWYDLNAEPTAETENYLWDVLEKIDAGYFLDMDDNSELVAAQTRAVLLKLHMDRQDMQGMLPHLLRFREYCGEEEANVLISSLTVRNAENLLSGYYLETGEYLLALDHSLNALNAIPPEGMPKEPSDVLIYSNLLLIYTALNDETMINRYIWKLDELFDEYKDDDYIMSRVSQLIDNATRKLEFGQGEYGDILEMLAEIHQIITEDDVVPAETVTENVTFASRILDMCSAVLDFVEVEPERLNELRDIINYFRFRPEIYRFNDVQKSLCYLMLTQIECRLESPDTLKYLERCLHYADAIHESREARIAIERFAAVVYYLDGREDLAMESIERLTRFVTSAWQKATAYLNDQRVCQVLTYIQLHYKICHALLRRLTDPEQLYERVLQFKDLPSLVGRERNSLLRLEPVDRELRMQIFNLQDQLAAAELNDSLKGTDTTVRIAAQLERLEANFVAKFPQNLHFTRISFDRVCQKLPENTAILEYYFVLGDSAISRKSYQEEDWELDVFVTTKRGGKAKLNYFRIREGAEIAGQAMKFTSILQDPDALYASGQKATLRGALYRKLIAPALPFLEGVTDLYIAPDDELCNLPFEILYAEGTDRLQDQFKICRLVCGRDLLFYDDNRPSAGGCFILGDPNYESERGEKQISRLRGSQKSLKPVEALPFSGIEAERISRRFRTRACTGDAATKYALQEALPCSVIHLATHGIFDKDLQKDSLYASHLVFAGYNRWISSVTESSCCGNGILTADEISRMDLRKTELVVLSACQSGLGDIAYSSVRGLISAFSAAGARWMVSHMWVASDFATPILMDAFYKAYHNQGRDVPDALSYAKNYLKTVTIGELRRDGWLDLPKDDRFTEETLWEMEELRQWPEDEMPFADEFFWGGFTVHKSR